MQSCVKAATVFAYETSGSSNVHSGDGGSNAGVFLGWNSCSFDAVNAYGRLVGLASTGSRLRFLKIRILDAAFCNSLDCVLYNFDEPKCENNYPNNSET